MDLSSNQFEMLFILQDNQITYIVGVLCEYKGTSRYKLLTGSCVAKLMPKNTVHSRLVSYRDPCRVRAQVVTAGW
jgi:hypothetical protein